MPLPTLRLQATVLGMMELKEFPTFKQHVRDFLVQVGLYSHCGCTFAALVVVALLLLLHALLVVVPTPPPIARQPVRVAHPPRLA